MKGTDDGTTQRRGQRRRRVCSVRLSEQTLDAIGNRLGPYQSTADYIREVLARELGLPKHQA